MQGEDAGPVVPSRKHRALELLADRKELPIWSARNALVRLIADNETVVLVGETGSGKTTQAPQFVADLLQPQGVVACTQPRRVAAIAIARRVAEEQGCRVGDKVGYAVRFDDATTAATRVKYLTDGLLIREAILDPRLRKYSVVFVDEAHERTVNTDVLLGLLKRAQAARRGERGLRVVVMSATLEQADFLGFFPGAAPARVEGRQYSVDVLYTAQPQASYLQATLNAIVQIHASEPDGGILAFLAGQDDIEAARATLAAAASGDALQHPSGHGLHVLAIYGTLPPDEQARVFEGAPVDTRKVVLATNIAETSVTIPGVRYVVDSGVVKARAFSAARGVESLQVVPTSQAQARQRAGRAGREAPGKCFRLYPEAAFAALPATTIPEIQRSNLATVVLQLKAVGVADVLGFEFLDPPPRAALLRALELLFALGALDEAGGVTAKGRKMARLPLEPPLAAALLAAVDLRCVRDCVAAVSMVSADRVLVTPRQHESRALAAHKAFQSDLGDHVTLLNVWRGYCAANPTKRREWCRKHFVNSRAMSTADSIYKQLQGHLEAIGARPDSDAAADDAHEPLRQALATGLFLNTARLAPDGRGYRALAGGGEVHVHPSSALAGKRPKCIVFDELLVTSRPYARGVSVVDAAWLAALVPRYFAVANGANGRR